MQDNKSLPAKPITRFAEEVPVPTDVLGDRQSAPRLSVIVIAYAMPEQAERTLHSLSLDYQRGVEQQDYEVILVENVSGQVLGEERATRHSGDFRYYLREETAPTPIHAINFGVSQARGAAVAIMIDGARMLTPGVLAYMMAALRLSENPVICVPGYHLGHELQQIAAKRGYNEDTEAKLLASISWPEDGYRLFDISCNSGTSGGGFFKPIGESNCIALPKALFENLGGFDTAFTQRAGGLVNLDFYKRALEHCDSSLIILHGEGSFHQFHGGETTSSSAAANREETLRLYSEEYIRLRGVRFSPPEQRPIFFGAVPDNAIRYVRHSAEAVMRLNRWSGNATEVPRLSIILVGHRMPQQLQRTLYTLSTRYQRNVSHRDYEVILVENVSDQTIDPDYLASLGPNFHYFLREESGCSPVPALNFGLQVARGEIAGIMVDGAHLLTPRVLEHALTCSRAWPNHLIAVPVYHLGEEEQHLSARNGFDENAQEVLLDSVNWRDDGYELFRIGVWCGANPNGFMQPMSESNCFFAPRANLRKIGDADARFTHKGGGAINLHMYRALGLLPDSTYIVLMGEASFHQFHGGVTSSSSREEVMGRFAEQLRDLWQGQYKALTREPLYFGSVSPQAQALLTEASRLAERRGSRLRDAGEETWPERPVKALNELPFLDAD
jgi:hypothetical protein